MVRYGFHVLPFELVLKISEYLGFSDIWYLGHCSRQSRLLSYQILKQQYDMDLIQPRIVDPFGKLIHAAVAYLERHGIDENKAIKTSVLQSVANHMAIAIYDRTPYKTGRAISFDFLLDKTLGILLDHYMHDPTLRLDKMATTQEGVDYGKKLDQIMLSMQQRPTQSTETSSAEHQDIYAIKSTTVLMVDYLAILYQTISALFEAEFANDIHHRLLINHLHRLLESIKYKYHIYHTNLSSYSHNAPLVDTGNSHNYGDDFRLFIKFLCILLQTDLVTVKDIETFTVQHITKFFMTQPSDVSFTTQGGFKIVMRNTNHNLAIINVMTKSKRPAFYYQWKLWLQETQFRLSILLDLIRAIVYKSATSPPEFKQFVILLQDAVSALSLSQTMNNEQHGQIIPTTTAVATST